MCDSLSLQFSCEGGQIRNIVNEIAVWASHHLQRQGLSDGADFSVQHRCKQLTFSSDSCCLVAQQLGELRLALQDSAEAEEFILHLGQLPLLFRRPEKSAAAQRNQTLSHFARGGPHLGRSIGEECKGHCGHLATKNFLHQTRALLRRS